MYVARQGTTRGYISATLRGKIESETCGASWVNHESLGIERIIVGLLSPRACMEIIFTSVHMYALQACIHGVSASISPKPIPRNAVKCGAQVMSGASSITRVSFLNVL